MREQYDQSRKKVSRNCLLLGALEVVLGVLVYFEIAELPPLPFTDSRLPEAVGFASVYYGAYLLYWGGTLWQQAGDAEQWRQTVSRIAEKFCSHPILSLAVLAGLIATEWVIWKTTHVAIALLAAGCSPCCSCRSFGRCAACDSWIVRRSAGLCVRRACFVISHNSDTQFCAFQRNS